MSRGIWQARGEGLYCILYSLLGLYIFAFVIAIQTWISYIRCIRYVYPSPPVPGGGGEASTPLPRGCSFEQDRRS